MRIQIDDMRDWLHDYFVEHPQEFLELLDDLHIDRDDFMNDAGNDGVMSLDYGEIIENMLDDYIIAEEYVRLKFKDKKFSLNIMNKQNKKNSWKERLKKRFFAAEKCTEVVKFIGQELERARLETKIEVLEEYEDNHSICEECCWDFTIEKEELKTMLFHLKKQLNEKE